MRTRLGVAVMALVVATAAGCLPSDEPREATQLRSLVQALERVPGVRDADAAVRDDQRPAVAVALGARPRNTATTVAAMRKTFAAHDVTSESGPAVVELRDRADATPFAPRSDNVGLPPAPFSTVEDVTSGDAHTVTSTVDYVAAAAAATHQAVHASAVESTVTATGPLAAWGRTFGAVAALTAPRALTWRISDSTDDRATWTYSGPSTPTGASVLRRMAAVHTPKGRGTRPPAHPLPDVLVRRRRADREGLDRPVEARRHGTGDEPRPPRREGDRRGADHHRPVAQRHRATHHLDAHRPRVAPQLTWAPLRLPG